MRRLLLAAGITLILHAFLFSRGDDWMRKHSQPVKPKPLRVTLSHRTPDKIFPQPMNEFIYEPTPETKKPVIEKKETVLIKKPDPLPKVKKIVKAEPDPLPEVREVVKEEPLPEEPEKEIPVEPIEEFFDSSLKDPIPYTEQIDESTTALLKDREGPALKKEPPPVLTEAVPVYKENPLPKYPRIARRRGYEGTVYIDVFVDAQGKVKDLRLAESSGYQVLDGAAMEVVEKWLFEPGRMGDRRTEMWVKIPVRFQLN